MTPEEIFKIKEHIEIHARREPHARKITEILNKAVKELEAAKISKGIKIEVENELPIFLYNKNNVIDAIAHALYYSANPDSEMCIPNCAYIQAEKMFDEWVNDTRIKNVIDVLNENIKKRNIELFGDQNN